MIHCPACQEPSPESARSCSVCGGPLVRECCPWKQSAWWLLPLLILLWLWIRRR